MQNQMALNALDMSGLLFTREASSPKSVLGTFIHAASNSSQVADASLEGADEWLAENGYDEFGNTAT